MGAGSSGGGGDDVPVYRALYEYFLTDLLVFLVALLRILKSR